MISKCHHYVRACDDAVVTSATNLNGDIYVTSARNNSIVRYDTDLDGLLVPAPCPVWGCTAGPVRFLGSLDGRVAFIPASPLCWGISVFEPGCEIARPVTIAGCPDLARWIIRAIVARYPRVCGCAGGYHLVGFLQYNSLNLFVQGSCGHRGHNSLYVVKAYLDPVTLELGPCLEVTNEYNLYRLSIDQNVGKRHARCAIVTGVYYSNNRVFLVTRTQGHGYLWEMRYLANITYLGPPLLVTRLGRCPTAVYAVGPTVVVVNSVSRLGGSISYYTINLCIPPLPCVAPPPCPLPCLASPLPNPPLCPPGPPCPPCPCPPVPCPPC